MLHGSVWRPQKPFFGSPRRCRAPVPAGSSKIYVWRGQPLRLGCRSLKRAVPLGQNCRFKQWLAVLFHLTANFYILHIIILYAAKYCNRKNGLQPKLYRPNLPPRHRRKVPRATPSFSPRPCRQAAITPSQFLPRFLDLRPKWTPLALPPQSLPPAAGAEIPALFAAHGAEGNVANQSTCEGGCPAEACPGLREKAPHS